jgi:hypothetical protein
VIIPSALNIKMKFPEFQAQDDATIEFAIEEAQRSVDDSWIAADQTLAIMYLAGHYLMVSIQRAESAEGEVVQSERIGPLSITYKIPEQASAASASDLTTTAYGTRFRELLVRSNPAVAIV